MNRPRLAFKDLRRQGLLLVVLSLGGFLADYAFNASLSRLLGTHHYGDFRVAWAFASLCGVVVLLGGDRATPHALAGPFERHEPARAWEYLRFYMTIGLALSAVIITGTWLVSYLHIGDADPLHHHAMSWAVLAVPVAAVGALFSRALQAARHYGLAAVPWRLGVPLLNLALVLALLAVGLEVEVHVALLLALAVVVTVSGWQWIRLRQLELPLLRRDPAARSPRRWLATSLPMMGVFLVAVALDQSDLYFLEALGDEMEVGFYAAAGRTAHFLLLIQTTLVGLVAPHLQLALEEGPATVRSLLRRAQGVLTVGVAVGGAVVALAAAPLLDLFGSGFDQAVTELRLLVVGNFFWACAALAVLRLQYTGHGLVVVLVSLATLVVDSIANALLIPAHGMTGAAVSTAATTSLAALAILVAAWRLGPGTATDG